MCQWTGPKYIKDLVALKKPTINYNLRICLDNTLLIQLENLTFLKSKAILQYSAPKDHCDHSGRKKSYLG